MSKPEPTLNDVYQEIGSANAKLDILLKKHDQLEARVRKIEGWKSWVAGWAVGISALVSYLVPKQ